MENIGDWLYLVIIIIAAISSFIGSINKKNKQAAGKQRPREIVTEDWEEKNPWNRNTESPPPVMPKKQPTFRSQSQTQQTTGTDYRQFGNRKKTEKDYSIFQQETSPIFPNTEEDPTTVSLEDMPTNTDEWRKAFIYNEVFKRKY
ncbi:MAG: hypothetical protein LBF05_01135 [Tannerella sp.]|nr:hypothetical protein [Tannerella sp.]